MAEKRYMELRSGKVQPVSWEEIKKGGALKASKTFNNKQEATNYARGVSKNQNSELVIHKRNGRIHRTASHGKDPMPPKDRDTNKKSK